MMSLIDASSIYTAIKEKRVRRVAGSTTIELARFELGNIVWKEHALLHHITWDEATQVMELGEKTLKTLLFIDLSGEETDILRTTRSSGLNYYDASYLHAAKELNAKLITEDTRLAKAATRLGIPSRSTSTLEKNVIHSGVSWRGHGSPSASATRRPHTTEPRRHTTPRVRR